MPCYPKNSDICRPRKVVFDIDEEEMNEASVSFDDIYRIMDRKDIRMLEVVLRSGHLELLGYDEISDLIVSAAYTGSESIFDILMDYLLPYVDEETYKAIVSDNEEYPDVLYYLIEYSPYDISDLNLL